MALREILPMVSSKQSIGILLIAAAISFVFYRLYLHPLSHVPGPSLARISPAFHYAICYLGIEGRVLAHYHKIYRTPVLLIAPKAVSVSDGQALHQIYVAGGGLPKDARYQNFQINGHDTIFSARKASYRDRRAKAVLPLFGSGALRAASEDQGVLAQSVNKFVDRLEREKCGQSRSHDALPSGGRVDILDLCSRLSIDVVTGHLFSKTYGGLDEGDEINGQPVSTANAPPARRHAKKLSATPFVLAIVALSRFSLLPNRIFRLIFPLLIRYALSRDEVAESQRRVDDFVAGIMDVEASGTSTYQSRLLSAGISRNEAMIQCKAIMFAGADSTAVKLATILFHLVQNPGVQQRLAEEISQSPANADPQTLPYLRAVIREGLRLGMANPTRLTRAVSNSGSGMTVSGFYLPPGTVVGAAAYVLHHNPAVYPEPFEFRPDRWLAVDGRDTLEEPEMRRTRERDWFPFGLGSRACLGRSLATEQLFLAVKTVIERGVLDGGKTCEERIEIVEWFNAEIKGHELEIEW